MTPARDDQTDSTVTYQPNVSTHYIMIMNGIYSYISAWGIIVWAEQADKPTRDTFYVPEVAKKIYICIAPRV